MTLTVIVTVIRGSLRRKTTNYDVILQEITHFSFFKKNPVQVNWKHFSFCSFSPSFQGSNLGFSKLASWEQRSSSWSSSYSHGFNSSSLYRNISRKEAALWVFHLQLGDKSSGGTERAAPEDSVQQRLVFRCRPSSKTKAVRETEGPQASSLMINQAFSGAL